MSSILGISAFYHDSAACILVDGKIIAAAQEERFTRKKHDPNYPHNAIEFVLKFANLKLSEVDQIVFFEKQSYISVPWTAFTIGAPKSWMHVPFSSRGEVSFVTTKTALTNISSPKKLHGVSYQSSKPNFYLNWVI